MLDLQGKGSIAFDYGNNIRAQAKNAGINNAFTYQVSFQNILGLFFAKEKDLLDGLLYQETQKIYIKQMLKF